MRPTVAASVALAAALVALQLVPVDRTNPPVESDIGAPPDVAPVLRRACYDCHSHETAWPWYTRVAPLSWLVARDVTEGRRRLNLSRWTAYVSDPGTAQCKLDHIAASVGETDMPPWYYRLLHSEARLEEEDRARIARWAERESAAITPDP